MNALGSPQKGDLHLELKIEVCSFQPGGFLRPPYDASSNHFRNENAFLERIALPDVRSKVESELDQVVLPLDLFDT